MFGWFKKGAKKKSVEAGPAERIRCIEQRVVSIEKVQQEIIALLTEKAWCIDKVIIENMRTDKVELNLDRVDVQDLSGMLNIGMTHGASMVRLAPAGEGKGPGGEAVARCSGIFAAGGTGVGGDGGRPGAAPPLPEPVAGRPVIKVQYGVRTNEMTFPAP
ncbi:MAG: hypothetical protein M0Z41_01210 [Peptococcaceae bacterium]|nr:hypothetical protein [Peptococcaceae bacterium]